MVLRGLEDIGNRYKTIEKCWEILYYKSIIRGEIDDYGGKGKYEKIYKGIRYNNSD